MDWRQIDDEARSGQPVLLWLSKPISDENVYGFEMLPEMNVVVGFWYDDGVEPGWYCGMLEDDPAADRPLPLRIYPDLWSPVLPRPTMATRQLSVVA